jgi:hypothetical protein
VTTSPLEFFAESPTGAAIFKAVHAVVRTFGEIDVRVSKSQIAFRRGRPFAYLWRPGQYVKNEVPAVLSIALPRELRSERFKEVAHPAPITWMHHLELRSVSEVDDEVRDWLRGAFDAAG